MENNETESINFSINDSNLEIFIKNFRFPKKTSPLDISTSYCDLDKNKNLKKIYQKRKESYKRLNKKTENKVDIKNKTNSFLCKDQGKNTFSVMENQTFKKETEIETNKDSILQKNLYISNFSINLIQTKAVQSHLDSNEIDKIEKSNTNHNYEQNNNEQDLLIILNCPNIKEKETIRYDEQNIIEKTEAIDILSLKKKKLSTSREIDNNLKEIELTRKLSNSIKNSNQIFKFNKNSTLTSHHTHQLSNSSKLEEPKCVILVPKHHDVILKDIQNNNNKSYQIFSHKTNKENLNNYLKPKEEEEIKFIRLFILNLIEVIVSNLMNNNAHKKSIEETDLKEKKKFYDEFDLNRTILHNIDYSLNISHLEFHQNDIINHGYIGCLLNELEDKQNSNIYKDGIGKIIDKKSLFINELNEEKLENETKSFLISNENLIVKKICSNNLKNDKSIHKNLKNSHLKRKNTTKEIPNEQISDFKNYNKKNGDEFFEEYQIIKNKKIQLIEKFPKNFTGNSVKLYNYLNSTEELNFSNNLEDINNENKIRFINAFSDNIKEVNSDDPIKSNDYLDFSHGFIMKIKNENLEKIYDSTENDNLILSNNNEAINESKCISVRKILNVSNVIEQENLEQYYKLSKIKSNLENSENKTVFPLEIIDIDEIENITTNLSKINNKIVNTGLYPNNFKEKFKINSEIKNCSLIRNKIQITKDEFSLIPQNMLFIKEPLKYEKFNFFIRNNEKESTNSIEQKHEDTDDVHEETKEKPKSENTTNTQNNNVERKIKLQFKILDKSEKDEGFLKTRQEHIENLLSKPINKEKKINFIPNRLLNSSKFRVAKNVLAGEEEEENLKFFRTDENEINASRNNFFESSRNHNKITIELSNHKPKGIVKKENRKLDALKLNKEQISTRTKTELGEKIQKISLPTLKIKKSNTQLKIKTPNINESVNNDNIFTNYNFMNMHRKRENQEEIENKNNLFTINRFVKTNKIKKDFNKKKISTGILVAKIDKNDNKIIPSFREYLNRNYTEINKKDVNL